MPIHRALVLTGCLLLATAVRAQDTPQLPAAVSDVVYKGVVGKVLDAVPKDPNERVTLQRTGAVVSSTLTGRSLAAWVGLTNPVLLVAGALWGLFSASNIKTAYARSTRAAKPAAKPAAPHRVALLETTELIETAAATQSQVAMLTAPPAIEGGDE
jgi:hypothetical protein